MKSREQLIRKIEAQIAVADEIGSDFISLIKGEGKAILNIMEEQKPLTQASESVITHLMIIHTWAEFALEKDLRFFEAAHLKNIVAWTEDAVKLIKEAKK